MLEGLLEVLSVGLVVLAKPQDVIMYGGAPLHFPEALLHLMVEDTAGGCRSEEHPLHPVKPLMCLDDGFILGFFR